MKKIVALLTVVMSLSFANVAKAEVADTLLLYFPNRIMDFMDTFSLTFGFGPAAHGHVWATRAVSFGGGIGATAQVIKQINRQYGAGLMNGWESGFLVISAEDKVLSDTTRGVHDFDYYSTGIPSPDEKHYAFRTGARDYWSCGVHAAVLAEVEGEFHPIELADFFSGFFFIDIVGDDFTAEDLRM